MRRIFFHGLFRGYYWNCEHAADSGSGLHLGFIQRKSLQLIEAEWPIYAPMTLTIIGLDIGLLPNRCQAITWTSAGILLRNKLQGNFDQNPFIFIQENAFGNIICETAAILSRPQCVNSSPSRDAYMRQWVGSALGQIMACRLFGDKSLSKLMLGYC